MLRAAAGRALLALVLLVRVFPASAAGTTAVAAGPGDQSEPSVSGVRMAYTDDVSGTRQVWLKDLGTGAATPVSTAAVDHGPPDLDRSYVAFSAPDAVHLVPTGSSGQRVVVPVEGAAGVALSGALLAWDQPGPGGRDVAFMPIGASAASVIPGAGDEHGPSVAYGWLAWLDGGAVRLRDGAGNVTTPLAAGAREISLWASSQLAAPVLAAAVDAAGATDLVVVDATGAERARLALPGEQRNPTLFGEWVGLEDLASGTSQVAVWQWTTGRVVRPEPSASEQVLNDVLVEGSELRVAWADRRGGDLDVYLFTAALPLPDVPPGQASCDDPLAPVLAELTVVREVGQGGGRDCGCGRQGNHHDHGAWDHRGTSGDRGRRDGQGKRDDHGRWDGHGQRAGRDRDHGHDQGHGRSACLAGASPAGPGAPGTLGLVELTLVEARPVLVCIDVDHVSAAWVAVGDTLVATPDDFRPAVEHLEDRLDLPAGTTEAGAIVLGKPGSWLRLRILADGWSSTAADCVPDVTCPAPAQASGQPGPPLGCSSGGAGGSLGLAMLALAWPARRRRAPPC